MVKAEIVPGTILANLADVKKRKGIRLVLNQWGRAKSRVKVNTDPLPFTIPNLYSFRKATQHYEYAH
jgi:hypothetical protein